MNHDCLDIISRSLATRHVGLLVNMAGAGLRGAFLDHAVKDEMRLLALNCRAPRVLALNFGGPMRGDRRGGGIMLSSTPASFRRRSVHRS